MDNKEEQPRVWLPEDRILRVDFGDVRHIRLAHVQSAHHQRLKLTGSAPIPVMVMLRRVLYVDYDANQWVANAGINNSIKLLGVQTDTLLGMHLANMFINTHKPSFIAQAFYNESQTLAWIRNIQADSEAALG